MKKLILLLCIISTITYAKPTMSQKSYDLLMTAQKHIELNEIKQAKEILNLLLEEKNDYAKSYAYQYLANLALQDNKYKIAQKYYENIIKMNSLAKENIDRIKFSLSKISLSLEQYNKSIKLSTELLKDSKISKTDIYETLVYSYYYTKKFKNSIKYSKLFNASTKKKNETIYQILYSSYVELKKYRDGIKTLETMVRLWPERSNYWLQLTSLFQETKQYKKALSTIELAYKKKILEPKKNTRFYVNLLVQNNLYQKGSLVLENGIKKKYIKEDKKTFELLISSYLNAKEIDKSIKKLKNSKFAQNKKYKKILANLYYNKHHYKSTISTLKSTYPKNIKKFDADTEILLALCYFELEKISESKKHLQNTLKTKSKKRALEIAKTLRIDLKI